MEEVRGAFLGFYEKRLRLQLLEAELAALQESAKSAFVSKPDEIESSYSLITFETQTIESIVADTYPLTASSSSLKIHGGSQIMQPPECVLIGIAAMLLACGSTATPVQGYPQDHGPFPPGERPAQFPLFTCPVIEEHGPEVVVGPQVMVYGHERAGGPRLRAIAADFFEGIDVEVLDAQGNSVAARRRASAFPASARPPSAHCADLNGDRLLDFVLLAVRGDELRLANTLDWRFPKWVWFTARPNHKAAALTSAEKARIWSLRREAMFWEASVDRQPR